MPFRSAETGRYVSRAYAEANPITTVGERQMRRLVREHIRRGGDPFTPPAGIDRADLDWVGHGLNEVQDILADDEWDNTGRDDNP